VKNLSKVIFLAILAASATAAIAQAPDNYKTKCQMCHGADGLGGTPAGKAMGAHPFNSPAVIKESDADLIAIITSGKGKMPAYSGKLSAGEIKDLATYIRTLQK